MLSISVSADSKKCKHQESAWEEKSKMRYLGVFNAVTFDVSYLYLIGPCESKNSS